MIDFKLMLEYDRLCHTVSFDKQLKCQMRVFYRKELPDRGPIGSVLNLKRAEIFLDLLVDELKKEVV